jgi:hypothetical protein
MTTKFLVLAHAARFHAAGAHALPFDPLLVALAAVLLGAVATWIVRRFA